MTHCPAHWDEHLRWLDLAGPAAPRLDGLRLHTIGGDRPRDVAEGTRLRAARRYAIIRAQHALIAAACEQGHGCTGEQLALNLWPAA